MCVFVGADRPRECSEITGQHADGVYNIYPDRSDLAIPVFCDMHTENGKWTVSTFYPSSNLRFPFFQNDCIICIVLFDIFIIELDCF